MFFTAKIRTKKMADRESAKRLARLFKFSAETGKILQSEDPTLYTDGIYVCHENGTDEGEKIAMITYGDTVRTTPKEYARIIARKNSEKP